MFNEELFWFEFGDLIHNIVLVTVIMAQAGFVIWFMLKWLTHNIDFKWSPKFKIEGSPFGSKSEQETTTNKKGTIGPVEVDVKKNFVVDTKLDEQSVKLDEKIKGKVKTQKDKLKKLRG